MQTWQAVFLGARELSREISTFELEAFFTFSGAERQLIEQRRDPLLKLGLALQMGFLRMSGRLLNALRIVPGNLWRHLGAQFNVEAPDLASLRALYRRGNTLFEQQQLACQALGFGWMTEHQRRYLVSMLREEVEGSSSPATPRRSSISVPLFSSHALSARTYFSAVDQGIFFGCQ